jgi:hypothetical protein
MNHFFLIKSDLRDTNNVQRKKKESKKSCLLWGFNPCPSASMQLTVVLAYLNTLQSGGNALGGSYLNTKHGAKFSVFMEVKNEKKNIVNIINLMRDACNF